MFASALAILLGAAALSAEQRDLGRQLAEAGTLAGLLPLIKAKETEELIGEDPSLTAEQQAQLRATAERVFRAGYDRLMTATGEAYARRLSIRELRALVAFQRTPAARRLRTVTPEVIAATMQSLGAIDFKGDVRQAACTQMGKLCPAR